MSRNEDEDPDLDMLYFGLEMPPKHEPSNHRRPWSQPRWSLTQLDLGRKVILG